MNERKVEEARAAKRTGPVFLEYGFRPFFLGAGIQASAAMAAWVYWIYLLGRGDVPDTMTIAVPVHVWHAHEMIFGYALAVVAGFFLTAVPSWTGRQPVRGTLLAILFALWLAARFASWTSALLPPVIVAIPELAFIGMLSILVAQALLSGWSRRNFLFLPVLAAMFGADLLYHLGLPYPAHMLGLDTLLILIAVIGGRIVPAFTTNALRREGVEPLPRASDKRDVAAVIAMVLMAVADLAMPASTTTGAIAIVAGLLIAVRMIGWRTENTLGSPILWILHLGYAWLAFGLVLKGAALVTGFTGEITTIHALTVGAVGSMTLGVMSRAALGHTGRQLRVSFPTIVAYVLVNLAAASRVAGPIFSHGFYDESILISGVMWCGAFLIFSATYWPVLTRPRVGLAESG
jgi:uncharacterized protein involved in response to NO